MLEKLNDLPAGVDGVKGVGKISKEDYEQVMQPVMDAARRDGRKLRFIYQLGPDFQGFTSGAAWEDAKLGLRYMRLFEGCAIVTDVGWIREATKVAAFMMPCPVKVFNNSEVTAATKWLASLPDDATVSARLIPEAGVIVVEVRQALRSQDFDEIALTADPWIESHGHLDGIVIHAKEFPGWENLGAFLRHVRFVRDHQKKVSRVALAVDSKLAGIAPKLAEHFVKAEVKAFGYEDLDAAIAWAGSGSGA